MERVIVSLTQVLQNLLQLCPVSQCPLFVELWTLVLFPLKNHTGRQLRVFLRAYLLLHSHTINFSLDAFQFCADGLYLQLMSLAKIANKLSKADSHICFVLNWSDLSTGTWSFDSWHYTYLLFPLNYIVYLLYWTSYFWPTLNYWETLRLIPQTSSLP